MFQRRGMGSVTKVVIHVALGSGGYLGFETALATSKEVELNFGYIVISVLTSLLKSRSTEEVAPASMRSKGEVNLER